MPKSVEKTPLTTWASGKMTRPLFPALFGERYSRDMGCGVGSPPPNDDSRPRCHCEGQLCDKACSHANFNSSASAYEFEFPFIPGNFRGNPRFMLLGIVHLVLRFCVSYKRVFFVCLALLGVEVEDVASRDYQLTCWTGGRPDRVMADLLGCFIVENGVDGCGREMG
eukprot:1365902-Amorphochlora_amoeboformis.AAC.1